jgi:hypothetical protein
MNSQDRTPRRGHPEQDSQNRTGGTEQAEQDGQNTTGRTRQAEQDRQSKTGRTRQAEQDRKNRTGRTRQVEQDRQHKFRLRNLFFFHVRRFRFFRALFSLRFALFFGFALASAKKAPAPTSVEMSHCRQKARIKYKRSYLPSRLGGGGVTAHWRVQMLQENLHS